MNVRHLATRTTVAGASLVLCGLIAGGTVATVGTANAASTAGSTTAAAPAARTADTPVTGTTADKVIAAVKARYSTATITTVRKDADGSYDALGTDATGNKVFYDVSADLATITAGGHGGPGGRGPGGPGGMQHTAATAAETAAVKKAVTAKNSTATITTVRKDADGSFDALGTDAAGKRVSYDVSADYTTVTAHTAKAAPSSSSSTNG